AERLRRLGPSVVVVKGGHRAGEEVTDVVAHPGGADLLRAERVPTRSTHGTGCTLSAAIAAQYARLARARQGHRPPLLGCSADAVQLLETSPEQGEDLAALRAGRDFLQRALRSGASQALSPTPTTGHGPGGHLIPVARRGDRRRTGARARESVSGPPVGSIPPVTVLGFALGGALGIGGVLPGRQLSRRLLLPPHVLVLGLFGGAFATSRGEAQDDPDHQAQKHAGDGAQEQAVEQDHAGADPDRDADHHPEGQPGGIETALVLSHRPSFRSALTHQATPGWEVPGRVSSPSPGPSAAPASAGWPG